MYLKFFGRNVFLFPIENTETFCFRQDNELYFTVWYEDEDYREEVVVRDLQGNVIKRMDGTIHILPNGKKWLLT